MQFYKWPIDHKAKSYFKDCINPDGKDEPHYGILFVFGALKEAELFITKVNKLHPGPVDHFGEEIFV